MIIANHRTIQEIQQEFQDNFPFLKIEFYDTEHVAGEGSPSNHQFEDTSKTIESIRNKNKEGQLSINGHLKVKTLEKKFFEQYGLNVQVFRRSGYSWLQTVSSDNWTLAEQNNKAKRYQEQWEKQLS